MMLSDLANLAQLALGDPLNAVWLQATVEAWCTEAIYDYSAHFPAIIDPGPGNCTAGQRTYNLPASCTAILRVEYPAGQTPAEYLTYLPRRDRRFARSAKYYDWQPSNKAGVLPTLTLSATPTAGQQYAIVYTAPHVLEGTHLLTGDPVPVQDKHVPLLVLYVQWKAAQERMSVLQQQGVPLPNTSYLGDIAQNARNLRSQYDAAIAKAQAEITNPSAAGWTDPWRLDTYEPIY